MVDAKLALKVAIAAIIVVIIMKLLSCKKEQSMGPLLESYADYPADFDPHQMKETMATLPATTRPTPPPGLQVVSPTPQPLAQSVDLLPKPSNKSKSMEFGQFAPKNLGTANFVDATKFVGIDTQGSSLRNANYQLRRDPPIIRRDIGPWSGSTIESDLYRKPIDC